MTFPEALFEEMFCGTLDEKSVLMYDNFPFMYASEPGAKLSPKSCFLLMSLNI
jgi:hypothetical protein